MVRISREFADGLLAAGRDETLAEIVRRTHSTGRPHSFALGGIATAKVNLVEGVGRNVMGVLPTRNEDAPVIVIGAHYDHIPASGKLAKDSGFGVRPGADDNAGGVSALILLARALASTPNRRCTYVFVAFSGEEVGLFGSKHYVEHPDGSSRADRADDQHRPNRADARQPPDDDRQRAAQTRAPRHPRRREAKPGT